MIDCGYCNDGTAKWVVTKTAQGTDYTAQEAYLTQEIVDLVDSGSTLVEETCEECHGTGQLFVNPETGKIDVTEAIFAYEDGTLDARDTVILFARLIETSMCWKLQGSYGRAGMMFIEQGYISREGVIDWDAVNDKLETA